MVVCIFPRWLQHLPSTCFPYSVTWHFSHGVAGSLSPPLESGWTFVTVLSREYGRSGAMWPLRLEHQNATHFRPALLERHFLEPSPSVLKNPKQAVERLLWREPRLPASGRAEPPDNGQHWPASHVSEEPWKWILQILLPSFLHVANILLSAPSGLLMISSAFGLRYFVLL